MAKFFRRGARKSRRSYSRKPSAKKVLRSNANKVFRKKVLSVIKQRSENKEAYMSTGDTILTFPANTQTGLSLNSFNPVPNITRGTNEGERIGNSIKPHNLNIKGHLILKPTGTGPYTARQSRIAVRMMVVCPKQFNNSSTGTLGTAWYAQLLQKGNTTAYFTGKLSDLHAPINRSAITVYADKKFYLTTTQIAQVTASGYYHIDHQNATKFFNINIPVKKSLLYDDNVSSGLQPVNFAPIILMGWTYLGGESASDGLQDIGISFDATLKYEDP